MQFSELAAMPLQKGRSSGSSSIDARTQPSSSGSKTTCSSMPKGYCARARDEILLRVTSLRELEQHLTTNGCE